MYIYIYVHIYILIFTMCEADLECVCIGIHIYECVYIACAWFRRNTYICIYIYIYYNIYIYVYTYIQIECLECVGIGITHIWVYMYSNGIIWVYMYSDGAKRILSVSHLRHTQDTHSWFRRNIYTNTYTLSLYVRRILSVYLYKYSDGITHIYTYTNTYTHSLSHTRTNTHTLYDIDDMQSGSWCSGVTTISRLLKTIGLFCRILSLYRALLQKRPIILRSLLVDAIIHTYTYIHQNILSLSLAHTHNYTQLVWYWRCAKQFARFLWRIAHTYTYIYTHILSLTHTRTQTHPPCMILTMCEAVLDGMHRQQRCSPHTATHEIWCWYK